MSKRLIVNSELELIPCCTMLNAFLPMVHGNKNAELYLEHLLGVHLLRIIEDGLAVLQDLLFTGKNAREHLHSKIFIL